MKSVRLFCCVLALATLAMVFVQPVGATTLAATIGASQPASVVSDLPSKPSADCHSDWCEKVRTLRMVVLRADHSLVVSKHADSPLRRELVGIVRASRAEGISAFLVLSVTGKESTFARAACGWNAWGWNSCKGDDFTSFTDGARKVAHALRVNYIGKWQARTIEAIGYIYANHSTTWAPDVRFIMRDIFHAGDGIHWEDDVTVVRRS